MSLMALGLAGTGCISTDLRIEERDVIIPTGRVSWQPIGALPRTEQFFRFSGLTLEGDVSYANGEALEDNGIDAGESVTAGRTTLPAAGGVNARAGVIDIKGTVRGGLLLGNLFRLEPMIGFQVVEVEVEASALAEQVSSRRTAVGSLYGIRAGLQPHPLIEIYGRYMGGLLDGTSLRVDTAYTLQGEAGVRITPFATSDLAIRDLVSLFAGYRWSEYYFQIDKEQTDPKIELGGPVLGLDLRF